MTFPRPRRRTCPQTLPTSLPPARALGLKGAGVGGEPAPRWKARPTRSPLVSGSGCPQVPGAGPGAHLEGRG